MPIVMKKPHFNEVTGAPVNVLETLNRKIGAYRRSCKKIKIGITGRMPQYRLQEHKRKDKKWTMVVIYITSSEKFANQIERYLVNKYWCFLENKKKGGNSELSKHGNNYVYVLLQ